ncbi:hypothetical protein Q4575_04440 [Psychrosphaera sp. 1_MG-2023]|nr:hypothetical protein [Psychrosphaera sp. 1_MG-2023]MDO6718634.1 hypothetical protein [Psychrosphaera sp. 1_MG-2023]
MMNIRPLIQISILLALSGCATVDGWFAPEIKPGVQQQALVNKSGDAELQIDPNAKANDKALMGDALQQPETFLLAEHDNVKKLKANDSTIVGNPDPQSTNLVGNQDPQATQNPMVVSNPSSRQLANTPLTKRSANREKRVPQQEFSVMSQQRQLQTSVENDYAVFQSFNHQFIKNNSAKNQYKSLDKTVSHFVMDLISNLSSEHYGAPLVVRPMKLKVTDVANPEGGKELITSMIAAQMKDYGFNVYDGRKPKGKFTGDEVILETIVDSYGDQFVLYGTLTLLKSNTVAGTHNTFISDFFFRNIKDGVEVYTDSSNSE